MKILFVMDPAESMTQDKDTSFAFMRAAQLRGHELLHCLPHQVGLLEGKAKAWARPIKVAETAPIVSLEAEQSYALEAIDVVFIRKDPPFDAAYLYLTQVLEMAADQTLIVNQPQALRDANEKLFACKFPQYCPKTLVDSSPERLLAFAKEAGGAVIKPLDGAGGSGVMLLRPDDKNARAIADLLTREGRQLALIQTFIPEVSSGDKRVLMLDGKVLGAIRRVPRADDIRANIHVGGSVEATDLTPREQEIAEQVGKELSRRGLWFVGLDMIHEHLIEVNVTSPTGIQEYQRLSGKDASTEVIAWAEERVKTKRYRP